VSSNPEYSGVVGKQFKAKKELWASGIMSKIDYPKKVDYVVLVPGVGISGREVVTREKLNGGFIFRVVRILRAKYPRSQILDPSPPDILLRPKR